MTRTWERLTFPAESAERAQQSETASLTRFVPIAPTSGLKFAPHRRWLISFAGAIVFNKRSAVHHCAVRPVLFIECHRVDAEHSG
jgi:hypothetical protein